MPRRPWRSLNSFNASPIRVPLDQSGAAAAARSIARSGCREPSARVNRVRRVANTNASAPRPLPAADARNCRYARASGSIEREMSHSITSRRRTSRRCRRARRIGSPAVRRLPRSVRRMSMRRPCPRSYLRVRRIGVASCSRDISRYSWVSSSGSSASKLLEARRSSSLAIATGTSSSAASPLSLAVGDVPRAPCGGRCSTGALRTSSGSKGRSPPKTEKKTRSNAFTCALSETKIARAVQYSLRRDTGLTRSSARPNSPACAGVTGRPASRRRRPNAPASGGRSSTTLSTPKSVTAAHELVEAGCADHLLVLGVLQYGPQRSLDRRGVETLDAQQIEGSQPVDRLRDPRRLLHVAVAHPRHRVGDLHRQRLRRAAHAPPDDLDLAVRRRVRDPVIEAAALHGVVQVARAVRGQNDRGRGRGPYGAALRGGHR